MEAFHILEGRSVAAKGDPRREALGLASIPNETLHEFRRASGAAAPNILADVSV